MLRIFVLAVALSFASIAHAADIIGTAIPVDGDTLDIHGTRVSLDGIDAPESRQTCKDAAGRAYRCGQVSANALDVFLSASQPIRCRPTGRNYERIVAICQRYGGTEVNRWLVANGYAVDWPKYSHGRYSGEQRQARAARLGIWSGRFEMPCAFRGKSC